MTVAERIRFLEVSGITIDASAIHAARRGHGRSPLWIAELSQIWGGSCWLYFGFVIDRGTRRCLGWRSHQVPHADLIVDALLQASATQSPVAAEASLAKAEWSFAQGTARPVPVVFGRGTLNTDLAPPRWALASAPEAGICERFLTAMRRDLVEEDEASDERAGRSLAEARRTVATWIERSYNPAAARPPRLERGAKPQVVTGRGRLLPRLDGEAVHQRAT